MTRYDVADVRTRGQVTGRHSLSRSNTKRPRRTALNNRRQTQPRPRPTSGPQTGKRVGVATDKKQANGSSRGECNTRDGETNVVYWRCFCCAAGDGGRASREMRGRPALEQEEDVVDGRRRPSGCAWTAVDQRMPSWSSVPAALRIRPPSAIRPAPRRPGTHRGAA